MLNRNYIVFFVSIGLFVFMGLYSLVLYVGWDDEPEEKEYAVEVNLPVIDWQKYTNLSKQYGSGNLKEGS